MSDIYTHLFDNVCRVVIPGAAHGFQGLKPEDITCFDQHFPAKPLHPGHVAIDPVTGDITLTFFMAETGKAILAPHTKDRQP